MSNKFKRKYPPLTDEECDATYFAEVKREAVEKAKRLFENEVNMMPEQLEWEGHDAECESEPGPVPGTRTLCGCDLR